MKRAVSLKDVARKAGVGIGTASRAMNNNPSIKPETKKLVLDAAQELNYKANTIARGLRLNLTHTIGVIIPDITSPFYPEVVRGIEDRSNSFGYNIILCSTDLNKKKEIDSLYILKSKMVDGIIFLSNTITKTLKDAFSDIDIPVVLISTKVDDDGLPSVSINNEEAAFAAVDYLCKLGHRKIAMISGKFNDPNSGSPRIKGYKRALRENARQVEDNLIYEGDYKLQSGYKNMLKILERSDIPTAVFAASDEMAIGASRAILENGRKIPEDISVVGFDGIDSVEFFYPPISTVEQPRAQMGSAAMELLMKILKGEKPAETRIILSHRLVERNSCKKIE